MWGSSQQTVDFEEEKLASVSLETPPMSEFEKYMDEAEVSLALEGKLIQVKML